MVLACICVCTILVGPLLLAAAALTACTSDAGGSLRLHVTPARALFDAAVTVDVAGAPAGSPVTIATREEARNGTDWTARAVFAVSTKGAADTGQAPLSGNYHAGRAWSPAGQP